MLTKLGVTGLSNNEDDVSQRGTISTIDTVTLVAGKSTKKRERKVCIDISVLYSDFSFSSFIFRHYVNTLL